mgnify:CR=1 FL=1|jgi:hypothetical protein
MLQAGCCFFGLILSFSFKLYEAVFQIYLSMRGPTCYCFKLFCTHFPFLDLKWGLIPGSVSNVVKELGLPYPKCLVQIHLGFVVWLTGLSYPRTVLQVFKLSGCSKKATADGWLICAIICNRPALCSSESKTVLLLASGRICLVQGRLFSKCHPILCLSRSRSFLYRFL